MDAHHPSPAHVPGSTAPLFAAQRPDHAPPDALSDDDLSASIESLHLKLRSARLSLLASHLAGASLTLVVLGAGFAVLLAGPAPFFERFLGHEHVTTTVDAAAWWLILVLLAILGGAFGDQLLRGKLRLVRGWRHRVHELEQRLHAAEAERRRRASS